VSTLQIVLLVFASASTAGLAWTLHRNTRRRHDRLLHLASHDQLTGLWNRAALLADLTRLHADGRPILFAIVNVDEFAQINRWHGYRGDDQLLTLLAGVGQHQASLDYGAAYRLGRDEMAVLWPDQTIAASTALAAALLAAVNRPVEVVLSQHSVDVRVTASMGLAAITGSRTPPGPLLLGRANTALQVAKQTARGTAVLWQPGMAVQQRRRDPVSDVDDQAGPATGTSR
jgi:diguanylate cyclase (GGDEF)-like protein